MRWTARQTAGTVIWRGMLGASGVVAVGCGTTPPRLHPVTGRVAATSLTLTTVGLDADALDPHVNPCDDFYQFACGRWLASTKIPDDKPRWSRSFSEIARRNEEDLKRLLETASRTPEANSATAKLGRFYTSCMEDITREAAGIEGVRALLDQARAVKDASSLASTVARLHAHGIWPLFQIADEQDYQNATRVLATLDQGGLGLPDRDNYLTPDPRAKELRQAYVAHVERMMLLVGLTEKSARRLAEDVLAIETEVAKASKTRVERRNPRGMYNKIDRPGLLRAAPTFPWDIYFRELDLNDVQDVNVTSVHFFEALDRLWRTVRPGAWQSYLQWHIVNATATALPRAFVDEQFTLRRLLTGQKKLREPWKRCVEATDQALGDALGKRFVQTRFGGRRRDEVRALISEVSRSFAARVDELSWMDEDTRHRAKAKRDQMTYLVGFPETWRSYDFPVDALTYTGNVLAGRKADMAWHLRKIGQPVDRQAWQMSPPTVNAYYDPLKNHLVFPAGILQPPFYNAAASLPVNLGSIGAVVGHELTHGFDDEGSQFAGDGTLQNWWSPDVAALFKAQTECVVQQYASYEVMPGANVNGELTLGENIADLGGVKLAFRAYRRLRASARDAILVNGFSEDQQFFLAVGQAWCSQDREENARLLLQIDPHAPPRFRVNGSLANMSEFAAAFRCAEGSPMNPRTRCEVW